jgi:DNA ligase-1
VTGNPVDTGKTFAFLPVFLYLQVITIFQHANCMQSERDVYFEKKNRIMRFSELAKIYEEISRAKTDAERVGLLAEILRKAEENDLPAIAHFTLGQLVSPELSDRLGIGPSTIKEQISLLTGKELTDIEAETRATGDLSEVAGSYAGGKDSLEVAELWNLLLDSVNKEKPRSKTVVEVFKRTNATGAKYFTRMALNQMRINVGLGTLTRALSKAFGVKAASIEHLYMMTNDIGLAAAQAKKGESALLDSGLMLFRPYQFMNAEKIENPEEIIHASKGAKKQWIFETKYDGARLQIHIRKEPFAVKLYSRRLGDDTAAMPDLVEALRDSWQGGDAIIEGEAVAFDPTLKKRLPFQSVLQRIGRKHQVEAKIKEIPLVLYLFDLIFDDGENLMTTKLPIRRARLETLFKPTLKVKMTASVVSDKRTIMDDFFQQAVADGQEGIMVKDPDGIYIPGRRTNNWMKLKPAFETLDVVIVGGIWGSGRRKGLLSSLIVAVQGGKSEFLTVGKVGTGFSEKTLIDLTERLKPLIISTNDQTVEVEPEIVIEVDFQDIQKTDRYKAGLVLRIPRFKRERVDKSINEADTLERLKKLFQQFHV